MSTAIKSKIRRAEEIINSNIEENFDKLTKELGKLYRNTQYNLYFK